MRQPQDNAGKEFAKVCVAGDRTEKPKSQGEKSEERESGGEKFYRVMLFQLPGLGGLRACALRTLLSLGARQGLCGENDHPV